MKTKEKTSITVKSTIDVAIEKVWHLWTEPMHIKKWNNASDEWHTPKAKNDLRVGGKFLWRMEAKDGSAGFDFSGEFTKIDNLNKIEYTLDDGRKVQIAFAKNGSQTIVTESFEAETTNSIDLQRTGWQAILNNFKKYAEKISRFEKIHQEISINASSKVVYETMLDENKYSEWTSEFNPTSHFDGSWKKGSKIIFKGTDENGYTGGMIGIIKENRPNESICIEYIGTIEGDKEITSGPGIDEWAGAQENYNFKENNGITLLSIDLDSPSEFKSYFEETWPKALAKLKSMCEK